MNSINSTSAAVNATSTTAANDEAKAPVTGQLTDKVADGIINEVTKVTEKKMTKEQRDAAKAAKLHEAIMEKVALTDDMCARAIRYMYESCPHIRVHFCQLIVTDNDLSDGEGNASRVAGLKELFASKKTDELIGSFATMGFRPGAKIPIGKVIPFDEGKIRSMQIRLQDLVLGRFTNKIPCGAIGMVDFHVQDFLQWLAAGYEYVIANKLDLIDIGAGNRRAMTIPLGYYLREKTMKLERCTSVPVIAAPESFVIDGKVVEVTKAVMCRINVIENGMEKVGTEELTTRDYIKSIMMLLKTDPCINQTAIANSVGLPRPTAQKYESFARLLNQNKRLDLLTFNVECLTPYQERLIKAFGVSKEEMRDAAQFKGISSGAEVNRYMAGDYNDPANVTEAMVKEEKAREKVRERSTKFVSFLNGRKPLFASFAATIRANKESSEMEKSFATRLETICSEGYQIDHRDDIVTMGYLLSYVVGGNRRTDSDVKSMASVKVSTLSASLCSLPGMAMMAPVLEAIASGNEEAGKEAVKGIVPKADLIQSALQLAEAIGAEAATKYIEDYEANQKKLVAVKSKK